MWIRTFLALLLVVASSSLVGAVPFGGSQACYGASYACLISLDDLPVVSNGVTGAGGGPTLSFYDLKILSVSPLLYAGGPGSATVLLDYKGDTVVPPQRDGVLSYYIVNASGNELYLGKEQVAEGSSNQSIAFQVPESAPGQGILKVVWTTESLQPAIAEKGIKVYTTVFLMWVFLTVLAAVLGLYLARRRRNKLKTYESR